MQACQPRGRLGCAAILCARVPNAVEQRRCAPCCRPTGIGSDPRSALAAVPGSPVIDILKRVGASTDRRMVIATVDRETFPAFRRDDKNVDRVPVDLSLEWGPLLSREDSPSPVFPIPCRVSEVLPE